MYAGERISAIYLNAIDLNQSLDEFIFVYQSLCLICLRE